MSRKPLIIACAALLVLNLTALCAAAADSYWTLRLDLRGRRALLESVLEVVYDETRSVIVSSHMLGDVERIADRLLVLNKGQVVQQGPTPDLVGENRTLEEALLAWGAA